MNLNEVINRIIDDGVVAAKRDYSNPRNPNHPQMQRGAVAGFEACRGLEPEQLLVLWNESRAESDHSRRNSATNYWEHCCFELEVEWVCNCVSAVLYHNGLPSLGPLWPTAKASLKVAEITEEAEVAA